jgi:alpha-aminoadipate carrier protein LysW
MALCPECENPLDFDEEEVEEGEVILCDECGSEFEVVSIDPLEMTKVEEGYDSEDEQLFTPEDDE